MARFKRRMLSRLAQIGAKRVQQLLGAGAQLVEVLPRDRYEGRHIRGAISLPLKELDADSASTLDRRRPVIVYCWDSI
jgi:rhodanese-related sulfurtransferase